MISNKFDLIIEEKSPLFRIVGVWNANNPLRRSFSYNVCAFHIGNGFIMTVGHVLRSPVPVTTFRMAEFSSKLEPLLDKDEKVLFAESYELDEKSNLMHMIPTTPNVLEIQNALRKAKFDNRSLNLEKGKLLQPALVIDFNGVDFYHDRSLTVQFDPVNIIHDGTTDRHLFYIDLQLVEAWYAEDIAIYKIINTNKSIIDRIPWIEIDFRVLEETESDLSLLQRSPNPVSYIGRLLNEARIKGFCEHHGLAAEDPISLYFTEGFRYLTETYFRFGSSGAPYIILDRESKTYKVNAIQSEAAGIQLTINNQRDGNFQYTHGIATPLMNIESELRPHL